jgi:hypothetical protein
MLSNIIVMCDCENCKNGRCDLKPERRPRGPLDIPKGKNTPEDGSIPVWCPKKEIP